MKEVIDTRFLAEYSNSTKSDVIEKTHRKLDSLISKKEGILPTIVIAEMIQITCGRLGKDMAGSVYQALIQSGLEIQNLTPQIAQQAGLYKCVHRNLPMGDCVIAATALLNHARVLSDDAHYDCIEEIKRVWI
ncbi:MAG: PIN domain-containing protein [Candidatus Bathyarchaeia archaeon]